MAEKKKVLITVMTYPHPSKGYQEVVCTAGVTEDAEWIRLYPIDYRYQPHDRRFKKYQWIEFDLDPVSTSKDNRKESHRPNLDTFRLIGEPLDTKNGWRARREIIDPLQHHTVNELKELFDADRTSLGIVRPTRVLDMEIRPAEREWKANWQALWSQLPLFGPPQKALTKLPYSFHYVFECEDSSKPHTAMCEDWELGVLFLKEVERLGSEEAAAQSVKDKYLGELCREDKDTRFFMGTRFPYNTWLVVGVFWPPKQPQGSLF